MSLAQVGKKENSPAIRRTAGPILLFSSFLRFVSLEKFCRGSQKGWLQGTTKAKPSNTSQLLAQVAEWKETADFCEWLLPKTERRPQKLSRRLAASPVRALWFLWQATDCWMGQERCCEALRLLLLCPEGLQGSQS